MIYLFLLVCGFSLSVKSTRQKSAKDPNKPKRPPSAFFVFLEGFRKQFKEKNPNNKSVAAVGKAAGEQWKSMSDAVSCVAFVDKAPYVEKALKRKQEYEKTMIAYTKKQAGGSDNTSDESDKSKSEVNDDAVEGSAEEEEEDD
ncbi:hypothetical protein V2J09_002273 [Rumex salicifolius]